MRVETNDTKRRRRDPHEESARVAQAGDDEEERLLHYKEQDERRELFLFARCDLVRRTGGGAWPTTQTRSGDRDPAPLAGLCMPCNTPSSTRATQPDGCRHQSAETIRVYRGDPSQVAEQARPRRSASSRRRWE